MANSPYRATTELLNPLLEEFFGSRSGRASMSDLMRGPSADVIERQNDIRMVMEIPGMRPDEVEINIDNNVLTVSGEKKEEREEDGAEATWHLAERRYGRFSRSFVLPRDVEPDRIEARCNNGLLEITVPKSARARSRRIDVQSGQGQPQQVETEVREAGG